MEDRGIVKISQVGHILAFFVFRWVDLSNKVFLEILRLFFRSMRGVSQRSRVLFLDTSGLFRDFFSFRVEVRDVFHGTIESSEGGREREKF